MSNYKKRGYLLENFRLFHLRSAQGAQVDYHYHEFCKILLLISGGEDPVGGAGKGVATIHRQMTQAGMKHVTMKLIPGARHAILMGSAGEAEKIIGDWVAVQC